MNEDDLKQLEISRSSHRKVFDRHFSSLDEAKKFETNAFDGDDRAQVKLWLFYQDAKYDFEKRKKAYGQYSLMDVMVSKTRVVNLELAAHFRKLAQNSFNLDAVTFDLSVNYGNRDPLAHYSIYNHGRDDFYSWTDPLRNLTFQDNPHFRYKGDIWWNNFRKINQKRDPYIYFTYATKHTTANEFLSFVKNIYFTAIPFLEECARAGHAVAANELYQIYKESTLQYDLDKWFYRLQTLTNPLFDIEKADYWRRINDFLSGQGEEILLENFILSQDVTPGGLYNIGIALTNNQYIRNLYIKNRNLPEDKLDYGTDFIKRAAHNGDAAAAWFCGNSLHNDVEFENNVEKRREAVYWYRMSEELGHLNGKNRYNYLTKKDKALFVPKDGHTNTESKAQTFGPIDENDLVTQKIREEMEKEERKMFNFLVTGQKKAWDFSAYELHDTGRFTEYTQPALIARFGTLDDATIAQLKKLPTLFTYEGNGDQFAKVGYIKRVTPRAKSIFLEYEFDTRIPEFPFSRLSDQHSRMDIGGFEMSRTHWAIKEGDLFEILLAGGVIDEALFYSFEPLGKIQDRRFKVALSFPGEKRPYIGEIVQELKRRLPRGSIFYDRDFTDQLAVPNLDTLLQKIYLENSDLVVVFLCSEYEQKQWCGLEWRAIREHIKHRRDQTVMFMRFDDASVQGVFSTDGYVDLRDFKPSEAAGFIINRIRLNELS